MAAPANLLRSERAQGLGFVSPTFLFLAAFVLMPVLGTVVDSFFRDVLYMPLEFIGIENYLILFQDNAFWNSVRFTVLFTIVSVPLEVLLALIIALVMNETFPFRGAFRACVLIPWAIPAAVSGRVFELVYNYSYGAANWLLRITGISTEPVNWLGTDLAAFAAVVLADLWKTTPFAAIILVAGLSAIPADLYAQARVDRAGYVRRFFAITLPLLWPVLVVALLFRTIQALRIFDVIYVLTGGGPGGATESLSLFAYRHFTTGDYGYGSAASVVLFVIALGLSIFYVRLGGFGGWR
ncbi:MAG: sugar ABC transporter permease [Candidatus Hydrogenedentes bacterium]|nr:sugar ABC transporter permease [Candidatus Hydrogenedentota bacterium]